MKQFVVTILLLIVTDLVHSQSTPHMAVEDKLRIREAFIISEKYGEQIWKGISNAPFAFVLVTDSVEFLVFHPAPTPDFGLSETDSILNAKIYWRKRQFSIGWLATFPAVGGINCIVAGTPENTGLNSTEWIITLLHEHFHQYEYSYPGYYQSVEKLELSGGDQSGMWMLNYPFAYEERPVNEQYQKYTLTLFNLLNDMNTKKFTSLFNKYKAERQKLKQLLKPADYRYLSFQIWQEGIARYTEYKFLELLKDYKPSKEIVDQPDFISFNDYKIRFYQSQTNQLKKLKLNDDKRVCFYAIGFAEGILLDKLNQEWRSNFLTDKFNIERYSKKFK